VFNILACTVPDVPRFVAEEIRSEVVRFWNVFSSKSPELLEGFYASDATVFASMGIRAEPGRLAVARRKREYFNRQTSVKVQIGFVDVQIIGDMAAVATYTFKFHGLGIVSGATKDAEETIDNGRATQVFVLDNDGHLRILHEHLSSAGVRDAH
jgi:ketosteroid isomerase-like protein